MLKHEPRRTIMDVKCFMHFTDDKTCIDNIIVNVVLICVWL